MVYLQSGGTCDDSLIDLGIWKVLVEPEKHTFITASLEPPIHFTIILCHKAVIKWFVY